MGEGTDSRKDDDACARSLRNDTDVALAHSGSCATVRNLEEGITSVISLNVK